MNNAPQSPQGPLIQSDANHTSIQSTSIQSNKLSLYKGIITLEDVSVVGTMNTTAGTVTIDAIITGSGSSDTVTVNNTFCTESSVILGSIVSYGGIIGTDGSPTLIITPGNNLFTFTIVNDGVTAAALDGELTMNFLIV